jgi:hypothetical protein
MPAVSMINLSECSGGGGDLESIPIIRKMSN